MKLRTALLALAAASVAGCHKPQPPAPTPVAAAPAQPPAPRLQPPPAPLPVVTRQVHLGRLQKDETLARALTRLGADADQSREVISALAGVFDFRHARAGDELLLDFDGPALTALTYRSPPLDEWRAAREGDGWVARKREVQVEKKVAHVDVTISSSLYESLARTGADPELSLALADLFAWDVDFYQDVRNGDVLRAMVEEYVADGKVVRYGDVLGAEYRGASVGDKKVFRYLDPHGEVGYFDASGQSARKTFLKSPLKYAHITSKFGMRFHPVLKYVKAHEGVDYGAAPGTPVWAVGDGKVVWAGMKGPNGNMVCLAHRNGFETCYCHLRAYGAGIKAGARVEQKQVIGYVGMTGRATGPHLHFALKQNGHFLNPLTQKFPRAEPVPPSLIADFHRQIDPVAADLSPSQVASAEPLAGAR